MPAIIRLMNGQLVVVKYVEQRPLLRKVCYANENVVFVTSEKAFYLLKRGDSNIMPIGFRVEDVFFYDGRPLAEKTNWASLKKWSE